MKCNMGDKRANESQDKEAYTRRKRTSTPLKKKVKCRCKAPKLVRKKAKVNRALKIAKKKFR